MVALTAYLLHTCEYNTLQTVLFLMFIYVCVCVVCTGDPYHYITTHCWLANKPSYKLATYICTLQMHYGYKLSMTNIYYIPLLIKESIE